MASYPAHDQEEQDVLFWFKETKEFYLSLVRGIDATGMHDLLRPRPRTEMAIQHKPNELTDRFGAALEPERVDRLEETTRPVSLQRLGKRSARLLKKLTAATAEGLGVARYVYSEFPILWVIDASGDVWFALEEVVDSETGDFILPRSPNSRPASMRRSGRLGHPALIGAGAGRIAGEIMFDIGQDPPCWTISNASGRYGLRPGRTALHLANAAKVFAKYGIPLKPEFIQPRLGAPA